MAKGGGIFRKGMEVEVSTNDAGFKGAWYAARVVRSTPKKESIAVEYRTLLSNDESMPLREIVRISNVRPLPPPGDPHCLFQLNDQVDALYNDGWWTGTITKVLDQDSSSFLVFFPTTNEEMEFPQSDLRLHQDWIGGRWVSPVDKDMSKMDLNEGTPVEVSSDEEGFQGVWFAATIIKVIENSTFLIEYQNLKTDDETELLRETADSQHIRPIPPDVPNATSFSLLEEVDALYNDGWWVGVISKVLNDSRYIVYFRQSNEEMKFMASELRPHQDWIDGKWFRPSQELKLHNY